tara:strand:+ start:795 stop:983 length:189 start_codon:yes stop_codon:yes gene_type:complete
MEVSNQMLAVLMLVLFIANYYVVSIFSKALEKASYENMLTLRIINPSHWSAWQSCFRLYRTR